MWFRAAWWMVGQPRGATAAGLQRATGLKSYETAWTWLQKLRSVMAPSEGELLRGFVEVGWVRMPDGVVRRDKAGQQKTFLVIIAAQADDGKVTQIRMQAIGEPSASVLSDFIVKYIRPGSLVITSGIFNPANLILPGYIHEPSPQNESGLTRVQSVFDVLTKWLNGEHRRSEEHLQSYLDEFTFRFNTQRLKSRTEAFLELLKRAVALNPYTRD